MSIEVAALRAEVKANQLQLQQQYEQTGDARGLLRQRSDQVDAVLKNYGTCLISRHRWHSLPWAAMAGVSSTRLPILTC